MKRPAFKLPVFAMDLRRHSVPECRCWRQVAEEYNRRHAPQRPMTEGNAQVIGIKAMRKLLNALSELQT